MIIFTFLLAPSTIIDIAITILNVVQALAPWERAVSGRDEGMAVPCPYEIRIALQLFQWRYHVSASSNTFSDVCTGGASPCTTFKQGDILMPVLMFVDLWK